MPSPIWEQVVDAFARRAARYFDRNAISFVRARRTSGVVADVCLWAPLTEDVDFNYKKTAETVNVVMEYRQQIEDLALQEQQANDMKAKLYYAAIDKTDLTLDGLARSVQYAGSEIEYPQPGSGIIGVTVVIAIRYQFNSDDPYTQ